MNKEVTDWVNTLVAKHAKDGVITTDIVARIVSETLMLYMKGNEHTCHCKCHAQVDQLMGQVKIAYDEVMEKIQNCCANKAGHVFCESFGCGNLMRIATQLCSVLPKEASKRE